MAGVISLRPHPDLQPSRLKNLVLANVGRPNDLSRRAGQHHTVMDHAQNLDNAVRGHTIDHKVARSGDTTRRRNATPRKPNRVGANTAQTGHLHLPNDLRVIAQGSNDR